MGNLTDTTSCFQPILMPMSQRNPAERLKFYLCLVSVIGAFGVLGASASLAADEAGCQYGPQNLLKTMKTPFTTSEKPEAGQSSGDDDMGSIGITTQDPPGRRSLGDRLFQTRLYLPDKMSLGKVAEFTIKGKPGKWVALAMADKDSGAKPIFGHKLRLGPDRKLVAIAKIPESGVTKLLVETPIQGDLVGSNLYFEAAVWSSPDMHDTALAQCVPMLEGQPASNAVLVSPQFVYKKGVKIIPTTSTTSSLQKPSDLSANKP